MLGSFVKNSAIYYLSNILTKGISFFLLPFYTSVFTKSDYGVLEMVSIVSTLAIIIFTFQINEGVGRYYNELKSKSEIKIYTSSVILFALISFGSFFLLSVIFVNPIAKFVNLSNTASIIATAAIALNGIFYLTQNQLTWKIKPVQQMICGLVYNLTTIGLTILLILFYKFGVEGIFVAQIIGATIGATLGIYYNRRDISFQTSKKVIYKLLSFSLPLIPNALGIYVFMYMDRIFIQNIRGYDELGLYSFSFKIASILMIVHFGMATALSPLIYKHYKEKETPEKITTIFRLFTLVSMITMSFLTLFSFEFVHLLAGRAGYETATLYIPFLLFSIYLGSLSQFYPGLIISKNTKLISLISILTGAINFVLNYLLIYDYGILGACIATAISTVINYFVYRHYSNKHYTVPIKNGLVIIGVLFFFCVGYVSIQFDFSIFIKILFLLISSSIFVFIFMKKSDIDYVKKLMHLKKTK